MITKRLFTEILMEIHKERILADRLNNIYHRELKNDFIDGAAFSNPALTDLTLRLLDAQFDEDCDWVRYWANELDFGEKASDMPIKTPNGHYITIETTDELWEWCNKLFDN